MLNHKNSYKKITQIIVTLGRRSEGLSTMTMMLSYLIFKFIPQRHWLPAFAGKVLRCFASTLCLSVLCG